MPRGRKRNQRKPNRIPTPVGESRRSKAYEQGKAVRYKYRIHGPEFYVTTYTIDDLPEGSTLI